MFKTLVATTLIVLSTGGYVAQPRNLTNVYTLNGAYCLKDTITFDNDLFDSSFTSNFYNIDNYDNVRVFGYYEYLPSSRIQQGVYMTLENLSIGWDSGYIDLFISTESPNNPYTSFYGTYHSGYELSNGYTYEKKMIIYFDNPLYVGADIFTLFTSLFTGFGNSYCTYYEGYFTYNVPLALYECNYQVYGSMLSNGNVYNFLQGTNTSVQTSLTTPNANFHNMVIDNNKVVNQPFIYISGTLISNFAYSCMSGSGVFNYVYEPVQYTFGEMIFSIIDAPIYMLSQFFNFELFGIQLYVAFCSILTLIIILCLVRKFI